MAARTVLYDAAGRDRDVELAAFDVGTLGADQLLWVDGTDADIAALSELPPEMCEAGRAPNLNSADISGVEIFDTAYRFRVPALTRKADASSDIVFVVGRTWLLTLSNPRPDYMDRFLDSDRGETLKGKMTPSALAAALLSEHMDGYRRDLAGLDRMVDELDETILRAREKRAPLKTLGVLRRRVATLRASLGDLRATIHALTRPDFAAEIDAADRQHFETLSRTLERLEDMVVRARETIFASFDLYSTRVNLDTNRLLKALTIVTVVTGIIGAIAGIFGMNFDTPFDHWGLEGFGLVTGAMVLSSLAVTGVAVWRRWL